MTCERTSVDAPDPDPIDAAPDVADGQPPDAFVMIDAAPLGPFSQPVRITELSTGANDDDPTLTADLLEIYFESDRGGPVDIYVATRASITAAWSAPTVVAELRSSSLDQCPEISGDGLTIYFSSDRPGGPGGSGDIYRSTRASRTSAWSTPVAVAELSTAAGECAPTVSADGLEAFWHRGSPGIRDLYRATRAVATAPWSGNAPISELNTGGEEAGPAIGATPHEIYFTAVTQGQGLDIYRATRAGVGQPFGGKVAVTELNTISREGDAWLSPDARTIFFVSDRAGSDDLYFATR